MNGFDRIFRVLIAIIIAVLYYQNVIEGILAYALLALAVIFAITSFIRFCPLYALFGISTCSIPKKK